MVQEKSHLNVSKSTRRFYQFDKSSFFSVRLFMEINHIARHKFTKLFYFLKIKTSALSFNFGLNVKPTDSLELKTSQDRCSKVPHMSKPLLIFLSFPKQDQSYLPDIHIDTKYMYSFGKNEPNNAENMM